MTALKAMTIWPAWQHFEEETKGSIEVGKLADFVILDKDPTTVDPETLDQIKVTETIKEGVTVFKLADMKKGGVSSWSGDRVALAFTRAMLLVAGNTGHDHHGHEGNGYCTAMSRLSAVIAGGDGS